MYWIRYQIKFRYKQFFNVTVKNIQYLKSMLLPGSHRLILVRIAFGHHSMRERKVLEFRLTFTILKCNKLKKHNIPIPMFDNVFCFKILFCKSLYWNLHFASNAQTLYTCKNNHVTPSSIDLVNALTEQAFRLVMLYTIT